MLKHLMSGSSLLAIALRDANNDDGADAKAKLRAELAKNTIVADPPKKEGEDANDDNDDDDDDDNDVDPEPEPEPDDANLSEEEKAAKLEADKKAEAEAKIAAKAQRKQDRMQRRIDQAIADAKTAKDELAAFKAANPDSKLSEEEVNSKAEALAAEKLAAKEIAKLQAEFDSSCAKLQKAATKINPTFDDDIADIAEQFGRLPSFMLGVLFDLDHGDEVLAMISKDDSLAEEIYELNSKPAKMTKKLVEISAKIAEEKKNKTKKQISKVADPITPVNGRNVQSMTITQADAKNMDSYVAKRQRQIEERRKQGR